MFKSNFAVYLGKEKEGGFSGFFAEQNLYLIIEIEEGISAEQGREMMQKLKDEVSNASVTNLSSFDQFVSHLITKFNLSPSISLAAGFSKDNIFYLKTIGAGKIFLKRGKDFAQIIEKDNNASGYSEMDDFFIFTTTNFLEIIGGDIELKTIFDHKNPHKIVEEMTPQLKGKDDRGAIAFFLKVEEEQEEGQIASEQKQLPQTSIMTLGKNFLDKLKLYSQTSGKKKTLTFVAVIVILFILVWTVVLGYQRRNEAELNKKIKNTKELVTLKLNQAEEVAFLNLPRSLVLISEAKQEVEKLKKQLGREKNKEVGEIEQLIKEKENKIVKKEEKNYEEFFDFTVDSKEAKGNKIYLDGDLASILDKDKGTIYLLSLAKKSLDKRSSREARSASLISSYKDDIIFFSNEGIFKMTSDGKAKKVIEKDKNWREISGTRIYNGNIYLLDKEEGDIYKYLVTDNGYGEKSSYLKGNAGVAKGANSLAIDSSVYVGFDDHILKFTAGDRDEFSTSWPEKNVKLTKIFTSSDVEKVYGWDKSNGVIYVLGKNGTYERQVKSSILAKADDFVVYNNAAYILVGEKIYKIALD